MGFKEQVAEDIDNAFFDTDEFAETVIIDSNPVPVIYDNDALNGKSDVYATGLSEGDQLIFVKQKDLQRIPDIGEQITINNKQWAIKHVLCNSGVLELRIGRKKGSR
jgi:hypothetical protein